MGPLGAVECNPVFDDPSRLETVVDLFEMNRFLFEAAPQSFNKCAVQVLTAPTHREAYPCFSQCSYPCRSGELAALVRILGLTRAVFGDCLV
jgi:hypothetical protein